MNDMTYEKLQFNELKERLKGCCSSELGQRLVDQLQPSIQLKAVEDRLRETSEARTLVDMDTHLPIVGVAAIHRTLSKLEKGMILEPAEFTGIADFLRGCRKIKQFMKEKSFFAPTLSSYALSMTELPQVEDEIAAVILNNQVASTASRQLGRIRKAMETTKGKIQERLQKFLRNPTYKEMIQEFFISQKDEQYTIPIKASYKHRIEGVIIEQSAKGATVFIEPAVIAKLTNELSIQRAEEAVEEYQLLATLTGLVAEKLQAIKVNIELIGQYDFAFAKGKLSKQMEGIAPRINEHGYVKLVHCKHPLLGSQAVPLNFEIGETYRGLIITGPNAGGKTVVLKTIGLLTLATMAGLHISGSPETEISLFNQIYVDIGDNQSMENALSTFSSHMKNISEIMRLADHRTLLLFDEIGSGTEPNEGAALAIAALEEFYQMGCIVVATTHYGEIKRFSEQHDDFMNAAMQFKNETLEPTYKLLIGTSGDSNALWIARKMALLDRVIAKAEFYMKEKEYDFAKVRKERIRKSPDRQLEEESVYEYAVGDKVRLLEYGESGVIYQERDHYQNVVVFYKGDFIEVNVKRLALEIKATDLYPPSYDLQTLFSSYEERKLEHDLARGSKKAWKKLQKETRDQ
ncbi:endonuclease MutS2 [Sporosarcina sp. Te-1]|uniref:endonuclease MutS2 n=1 Tax=Sporosarcina sp. Te-1 TaxID=2818390 RepID=UPI001A9DB323|nr:endonuclease MutS2 [Sporosarcina sp. Te-1]QTD42507.1 endonuclease MutS2 [Sporosarcina sp. Te-1]